ncbi:hypothetical protein BD779DRAFT_1601908, partial [Infundibulicybe gibba]
PMTIRDLQYALAVEEEMTDLDPNDLHDEGYLMSICVGLVVSQELGTTDTRRSGRYPCSPIIMLQGNSSCACYNVSASLP